MTMDSDYSDLRQWAACNKWQHAAHYGMLQYTAAQRRLQIRHCSNTQHTAVHPSISLCIAALRGESQHDAVHRFESNIAAYCSASQHTAVQATDSTRSVQRRA